MHGSYYFRLNIPTVRVCEALDLDGNESWSLNDFDESVKVAKEEEKLNE